MRVNSVSNRIVKKLPKPYWLIALCTLSTSALAHSEATNSTWQLVWQDEFSGDSLDLSKWNIEVNCDGGGNNEHQCYTANPDNLFLRDGFLYVVAKKAHKDAVKPYTSARINSKGKGDFKYARVEVRAKLPKGQGSWPAIWMLPTNEVYGSWPKSGEIDIMESVNLKVKLDDGSIENRIHGTLHYGHDWPNNVYSGKAYDFEGVVNPADGFHIYAVEWEQGEVRWYVDNVLYARQQLTQFDHEGKLTHQGWYTINDRNTAKQPELIYSNAPFDDYFHIILNYAVGGNWPENTGIKGVDAREFHQDNPFIIDYVKVFACTLDSDTGKGCENKADANNQKRLTDVLVSGKAPLAPTKRK